jgi:large subunit ribosomal protein L10
VKREEKAQEVKRLNDYFKAASAAYVTSFQGMKVAAVTELRKRLRPGSRLVKVVKNTLAQRAIAGTPLEPLKEQLTRTNTLVIPAADPVPTAKVLFDFAKENDKFKIRGGFLAGQMIGVKEIEQLAKCPPREVLLAKMLGSMKSPLYGLVNVLSGNYRRLVYALKAVADKKGN